MKSRLIFLLLTIFTAASVLSITWWLDATKIHQRMTSKLTITETVASTLRIRLVDTTTVIQSTMPMTTTRHSDTTSKIQIETTAQGTIQSQQRNKSAYKLEGYAKINMMQQLEEPRPLFVFKIQPWKINSTSENSSSVSLVVGVKSHADNSERRSMVRETWGSYSSFKGFNMQVFFVVGEPQKNNQSNLIAENMTHGDILQIDMKEVYKDVGKKALAAMQWVNENCPITWFYASSDDDMLVNVLSIYQHSNELTPVDKSTKKRSPENLPILCGFRVADKEHPLRPGYRNSVTVSEYDGDKYPTFCAGGFYTMSVKLSNAIFRISRQHKYFYNDDVWITGLLRLATVDAGEFPCGNITDSYCAIVNTNFRDAVHLKKVERHPPAWQNIKQRMEKGIATL